MGNLNEDKSEFNSALIYLQRLHVYFHYANEAASKSDMYAWLTELENLFRTLYNWIENKENVYKDIKELHDSISRMYSQSNFRSIDRDLYWRMNDLHLIMQEAFHKSGFETKTIDYARKTMRGK